MQLELFQPQISICTQGPSFQGGKGAYYMEGWSDMSGNCMEISLERDNNSLEVTQENRQKDHLANYVRYDFFDHEFIKSPLDCYTHAKRYIIKKPASFKSYWQSATMLGRKYQYYIEFPFMGNKSHVRLLGSDLTDIFCYEFIFDRDMMTSHKKANLYAQEFVEKAYELMYQNSTS